MWATSRGWRVGLAAAGVLGVASSAAAQSTAPPLTACQRARLQRVPRWELDYSFQVTSAFTAAGESGGVDNFFPLANWSYAANRQQAFRLVVGLAQQSGRTGCSSSYPCEPQHPATLTVTSHDESSSLEGTTCPGVHGIGCPGFEACLDGGHPFCGEPCLFSQRTDVVTPAPNAILDGTTGRRVNGELTFDYDLNPPTATVYLGTTSPPGTRRQVITPCLFGQENTFEFPLSAYVEFAQYPTSGGDTAVRLVDGRFVVQGQASGSDTRMIGTPVRDPLPTATFPRTWTGSATWTLREVGEPTVALVGVEVNQAVQDWQQSVSLVQDKATVVRAHLQSMTGATEIVEAQLRGFGPDGSELPGSPLPRALAYATPSAAAARAEAVRTADWVLPASWLTGDVELCVESPTPIACQEPAEEGGTVDDCGVRAPFTAATPLRVRVVGIRWGERSGDQQVPRAADLDELERRLEAIFPIARLDATRGELFVHTFFRPNFGLVNHELEAMRVIDCAAGGGCDRAYYGAVPPQPEGESGNDLGLANTIPGTVSSGLVIADPQSYARNVAAHEVAHSLGRPHAVSASLFGTDSGGNQLGPCGAIAAASAAAFPFFFAIDGTNVPTLGPMGSGEARKMFGFDTYWQQVIDPQRTYELMGYCQGTSPRTGRSKWISGHTYEQLRAALAASPFGGMPPPPNPVGGFADMLLVRGTVDQAGTAELGPAFVVPAATVPDAAVSGEYEVALRAAGGGLLASVPVTPYYGEADGPGGPWMTEEGGFVVGLPANPDTAEIALVRDGTDRAVRTSGTAVPNVTVTYPNGGETLAVPDVLAWSASDADGDPLRFLVQWSRDGGDAWQTLATDWAETTLPVDTSLLPATTEGRLRVVASDGVRSGVDESDGDFEVPPKAPRASILPPTGTAPIVAARTLVLRGIALDPDEGRLDDTALRWSSDLDGSLGTGALVILEGTSLREGTHTVTLTATDRDGLTGSASVPLVVVRQGPVCGDGVVDPGEACDDGNLLGDDECSADCLIDTTSSTTSSTIVPGSTTTTLGGPSTTTTTTLGSPCAGGCEDGDPCTEDGCVVGAGCVWAPRTGLAGAMCRCEQAPPAECAGLPTPRSLTRRLDQACAALGKIEGATGKAAKLARRAAARLRKAARVAGKLGKRTLPPACAEAWRRRFLEAREHLAAAP